MSSDQVQEAVRMLQTQDGPPATERDIEVRINALERIIGAISPTDDLVRASLEQQRDILELLRDAGDPSRLRTNQLLQAFIEGREQTTNLPLGRVGEAATTIPNGEQGIAIFEGWSGQFQAIVSAKRDIEPGQLVAVDGANNLVVPAAEAERVRSRGNVEAPTTRPEDYIQLTNETWANDADEVDPVTEFVDLPDPLGPGDEVVIYQATSSSAAVELFAKASGATGHFEDLDGDPSTADQSVIDYVFEYQRKPDGDWKRHDGLSDVTPLGTLTRPAELEPGRLIGPVFGWRLTFVNRTDDASLTDTDVEQDDMGARFVGEVQVTD